MKRWVWVVAALCVVSPTLAALDCVGTSEDNAVTCTGDVPVMVQVALWPANTGSNAYYSVCTDDSYVFLPTDTPLTCTLDPRTIGLADPTVWDTYFCQWTEEPLQPAPPVAVFVDGHPYGTAPPYTDYGDPQITNVTWDGVDLHFELTKGTLPRLILRGQTLPFAPQGAFYYDSVDYCGGWTDAASPDGLTYYTFY